MARNGLALRWSLVAAVAALAAAAPAFAAHDPSGTRSSPWHHPPPKSHFTVVPRTVNAPRPLPAPNRITRNAIGLPVTHNPAATTSAAPHDTRPAAIVPAGPLAAPPAPPSSATAGVKESSAPALQHAVTGAPAAPPGPPPPSPPPAGTFSHQATINGTGFTRPASSLGGPAKTVTGISGSAIRPKH